MGLHDGLELVEGGEWTDEAHGRAFMAAGRDGRVAQSASRVLLRTSGRVRSRVVERWREEDETKAGRKRQQAGHPWQNGEAGSRTWRERTLRPREEEDPPQRVRREWHVRAPDSEEPVQGVGRRRHMQQRGAS
jgi:hypothetical protein